MWVSVLENVPEEGERVIVWNALEGKEDFAYYYPGSRNWSVQADPQFYTRSGISHWMPVDIEPPDEKEVRKIVLHLTKALP